MHRRQAAQALGPRLREGDGGGARMGEDFSLHCFARF
jgi:hypothetical protein